MTFALIVLAASALAGSVAYGADRYAKARRQSLGSLEERTPVDRPAVNGMNTPIVLALFYVGGELRRSGEIMQDLARTIRASTEKLDSVSRERIARELKVTSNVVAHAAAEIKEAT